MQPPNPSISELGWSARLQLELEKRGETTRVSHVEHYGPLRIQRPFYPEDTGTPHLYLLHPPGGVAGGDRLTVDVLARPDASVLLTAPAAAKLYRSAGLECDVRQELRVEPGASMEWLPQETIVFSGARARMKTAVHLAEGARFIGWETLCLGRPAADELFSEGTVDQRFEIHRNGEPLFLDRTLLGEGSQTMSEVWGLHEQCVTGTLLAVGDEQQLVDPIRSVVAQEARFSDCAACTALEGVLSLRYVGPSTRDCWDLFVKVWHAIRETVVGRPPVQPRIWSY